MDNSAGSSLNKDKDTVDKIRAHKDYLLNRKKDQKFQGFEIQFSLDKEHIVLVEKRAKKLSKQLVIILDAYTLEVVDEHLLNYSLESISGLDADPSDEEDYDDGWAEYNTFRNVPNVFVWNKGRYLMVGQTLDNAVSIFQYEILDTKENKKYVISKEDHKYCFFVDFKVSPGNTDVLYVGGYDMTNTHCYEFDIKNQSIKEMSKGTSTNTRPTLYSLDESCAKQYHSRVGTNDKDKNVCRIYTTSTKGDIEIDFSSNKGDYTEYKSQFIGKADGNNFVGMEYNDRNELCVKVSGQINFNKTLSDLDTQIEISKIKDYGICNNNGVMILSNVTQSSFDVVFVRNKEGNTTRNYSIRETTFIYFYYPAVVLVKGCMEILAYSIPEDTYYYYPLKCPILFQSSLT